MGGQRKGLSGVSSVKLRHDSSPRLPAGQRQSADGSFHQQLVDALEATR